MAGTPIDELINNLYEMVEDAFTVPLGNDRCVLERNKVLDILDEIRANLPSDLKMARDIVQKRNDIITAGKKEYENLKKQADDYAVQRTNEHDIVQEARKKAKEMMTAAQQQSEAMMNSAQQQSEAMVSTAEKRSREIMRAASEYCEDAMRRAEEAVQQSLSELQESRAQFQMVVNGQQ